MRCGALAAHAAAFRVIQGAGGGGMQPMAQAIMADSFEPHKRGQAFALYGLVAVLAPSIGPTLGGWITDNFSWRWIFFINIPVGILAFILVTRLVEDPPWIKADRSRLRHMDYMGLGLPHHRHGRHADHARQGRGERLVLLRLHPLLRVPLRRRHDRPGLCGSGGRKIRSSTCRCSAIKNFAICCFLMMLVGGVLNANTVLQPQFMQQLLGWTATTAGLALTAGGFTLVIVMPLAGIATGKISARYAHGLRLQHVCHHLPLRGRRHHAQMSFAQASWLRVVQMLPLPFCFISITNAAYVGMPHEQSNQVSGLINFVRNIGGSILIAVTNAQVTSRSMWHEQPRKALLRQTQSLQHPPLPILEFYAEAVSTTIRFRLYQMTQNRETPQPRSLIIQTSLYHLR